MACEAIRRPFILGPAMRHFLSNQRGATAIEYALIAAVIILVMLGGLVLLGERNAEKYNELATTVEQKM